jgi:hypothetical protein
VHASRVTAVFAGVFLVALAFGQAARADIQISVDKSTQRMTVTVDGQTRYRWPVSTGRPGYETPSGAFRPFRMDISHRSEEWDNAPMPYSIFFTGGGDAVHGTYEVRGLGRAVSHGCVRISVKNAAILWSLVTREQMASTIVEIHGSDRFARPQVVAGSGLLPPAGIGRGQHVSQNQGGLFSLFSFRR